MPDDKNTNKYRQLEERTFRFAKDCRDWTKTLPHTKQNQEYIRQLVRSSGSQAANYIEANEALSKKDFAHRVRICRKEAKESGMWLKLCEPKEGEGDTEQARLYGESEELRKIFSAILDKSR